MDDPTVFIHRAKPLFVIGGRFDKTSPHASPYRRGPDAGELVWRDNFLECFDPGDLKELEAELGKKGRQCQVSGDSGRLAEGVRVKSGKQ